MEQPNDTIRVTRRSVLGAGLALAATPALRAAAQSTPEASPAASPAASGSGVQADGTWVFTDDRDITVTLPAAPQRVIADVNVAGALWDFGVRPVGVFGWNITGEDTLGDAGGNVDPASVTFLNGPITTIDAERAAAANPDLIVTLVFTGDVVWSILPDEVDRIGQIAPIVTISGNSRADVAAARFAELAGALGIDLGSPEIVEQQAAYEASVTRFTDAIAAKPGMSALFVAPAEAALYIANPDAAGDVMLFRDLGLDVPALPVAEGEYWEQLSLEEAGKYQTDLFFYSTRGVLANADAIKEQPTLALVPSVKAGQIFPWNQDVILNYPGVAASLDAVSSAIEASDPNVAP